MFGSRSVEGTEMGGVSGSTVLHAETSDCYLLDWHRALFAARWPNVTWLLGQELEDLLW